MQESYVEVRGFLREARFCRHDPDSGISPRRRVTWLGRRLSGHCREGTALARPESGGARTRALLRTKEDRNGDDDEERG